jgi:putative Holliday junction resolvase
MGRIVAIDYGRARLGTARSDPSGTIATPLATIERPLSEEGWGRLLRLIRENEPELVVVGLPVGLGGGETEQTKEVREFAADLERELNGLCPIALFDERLTTKVAHRIAREGPLRAGEDAVAAAVLLEGYLRRTEGSGGQ